MTDAEVRSSNRRPARGLDHPATPAVRQVQEEILVEELRRKARIQRYSEWTSFWTRIGVGIGCVAVGGAAFGAPEILPVTLAAAEAGGLGATGLAVLGGPDLRRIFQRLAG